MINNVEKVGIEKILLPDENINSPGNDDIQNLSSTQTRDSYRNGCWSFLKNVRRMRGNCNPNSGKRSACNGDIKENIEICDSEVVGREGNGGNKKWVAAMLVAGITDLSLILTKFAKCSETEDSNPRLFAGYLDYTAVSKNELWLPLCIFTIVGTVLFFPEFANTLSALFRNDGTTSVPLHVELLITLIFKHVPLATISYFTSKYWSTKSTGNVLEAAVTSSRVLFVSLRIVWYAHMEGIKVRKNDKYELKQVLFMFCCLLFSVCLAIPVMTLKFNKDSETKIILTECSEVNNIWITASWESSCIKIDDDSTINSAFNNRQLDEETPWKIYTSQPNDSKPSYRLQNCLNIPVCDLFKSFNKEYKVEYECPTSISEPSSINSNETKSIISTMPLICLLGMNKFIFSFYYRSLVYPFEERKWSVWSNHVSKVLNDNSSIDVILFTITGFCQNNPHKCHLFDSGIMESHSLNIIRDYSEKNSEFHQLDEQSFHNNLFRYVAILNEATQKVNLKPIHIDHHELDITTNLCQSHHELESLRTSQKSGNDNTRWSGCDI